MIRSGFCRNCAAGFSYEAKGGKHRPLCEECEKTYRWCPPCGYALPHVGFHSSASTRGGLDAMCKRCRSERSKNRHSVRDPRVAKDRKLRERYGVTLREYELQAIMQGGLCAICRREAPLVVDHCHTSGALRALLCGPCNKGLGHFEDDPVRLRAAAEYLERSVVQAERSEG